MRAAKRSEWRVRVLTVPLLWGRGGGGEAPVSSSPFYCFIYLHSMDEVYEKQRCLGLGFSQTALIYPCVYINVPDSLRVGFFSFIAWLPHLPLLSHLCSPFSPVTPLLTAMWVRDLTLQGTDGTLRHSIQGNFSKGTVFKV